MLDSTAFETVIGLIFIYLLYSLFATVLAEIIATNLALRARNLKEAVKRMLTDEVSKSFGERLRSFFKSRESKTVENFYNHPEIKYLGSYGLFKSPSNFKAISFSKTIIYILNGTGVLSKQKIEDKLDQLKAGTVRGDDWIFDEKTAEYIKSLWDECYGDIDKFKIKLEQWFDRTMEQATEWYKRKIQFILLLVGFGIAWFFNADTFEIVHKLSTDKTARSEMVKLASAYLEKNPERPRDIKLMMSDAAAKAYNEKLDSLLTVKKKLEEDIEKANGLLGTGSWPPDTVFLKKDTTGRMVYTPHIEASCLIKCQKYEVSHGAKHLSFSCWEKLGYFFNILWRHFFGFLVTAIAISLGAPFWFDLLNKMMRLRASTKQETDSPSGSDKVSPLLREA